MLVDSRSPRSSLLLSLLTVALVAAIAACGGSDSPSNPTTPMPPTAPPPPPPTSPDGNAGFDLVGGGQAGSYDYATPDNTVLCTTDAGFASLFLRFGEAPGGSSAGPHLDLDVCNHQGGGAFGPRDPRSTVCMGKTWDVFWHGADGSVFSNTPNAGGCTLMIDQNGDEISGTFGCRGLTEEGGARTVTVENGSFACTITD